MAVAFTTANELVSFAWKHLLIAPNIVRWQLGIIVEVVESSMNDPLPIAILYIIIYAAG